MEFFMGPTQTKERMFLNPVQNCSGFQIAGPPKFFAGGSSESENSSSIGTPDDSDIEDEEDEVQSNFKEKTGLGSLDSLEDSLPIKRGLSSHFDGKSKSFTNLSQVSNLKELHKQESPLNKRRRVLIASKWSRKTSNFYTWSNPQSMPLLPMDESQDDDDCDYEDEDEGEKARKVPFTSSSSSSSSSSLVEEKKQEYQIQVCHNRLPESYAAEMKLRLRSFKSRSFSLADLKENDDGEEDNDA